jgi:hypothetical protein
MDAAAMGARMGCVVPLVADLLLKCDRSIHLLEKINTNITIPTATYVVNTEAYKKASACCHSINGCIASVRKPLSSQSSEARLSSAERQDSIVLN